MHLGAAFVLAAGLALAMPAVDAVAAGQRDAASARASSMSDAGAQARPRPRVRIYQDSRPLGPNAVRHCEAHYEREFRPSGTVIVPRMNCFWRRG